MALKADVTQACRYEGTEKPVDLVHLSKVTMGDRGLELEVLKMFLTQIPNYISTIKLAKTSDEIYRAAHILKGAASNIGAFPLAQYASLAETNGKFELNAIIKEFAHITEYVAMISAEA